MSRKTRVNFLTGFTLLETIVALGIILSGVAAAFGLAITALSTASISKNKVIAANLAQEGIEIVRRIRDNNTIEDMADDGDYDGSPIWTTGIGAAGDCSRPYKIDVFSTNVSVLDDLAALRFDSATALYTNSVGSETPFRRVVEITHSPSCFTPMAGVDPTSQFRVRSRVYWTDRGVSKEAMLEEILFNWR